MRRREIEGKEESCRRSSKIGAKTDTAITISVVEEATTSSAGDNRACSDRRSKKDKYSGNKRIRIGNGSSS